MAKTCYRGELYYADLGKGVGSEQEGYRPVVIVQNNTGNKYSPTVITPLPGFPERVENPPRRKKPSLMHRQRYSWIPSEDCPRMFS